MSEVENITTTEVSTPAEPPSGPRLKDFAQILMPFFATLIVVTILGNLLVMTAVFTDHRLKQRNSNFFFVSLAVTDFLVGTLVMPFALENDMGNGWRFGGVWCYLWMVTDVSTAVASILHLVVISYDRLKDVQDPTNYDAWMTKGRVIKYIAGIWGMAVAVSYLPTYLNWFIDTDGEGNDLEKCWVESHNKYYAVVSAIITFYIPAGVMIVNYCRLY
jgi:hypothetical protein